MPGGRFEPVHAIFDWYDGPRGGVADYEGRPHAFRSDYSGTLGDRLVAPPESAFCAHATFRLAEPWPPNRGWPRLEVAWEPGPTP